MRDEELSRAIAQKLEPFEQLTINLLAEYRELFGDHFRLPHSFGHSPMGLWWFITYHGSGKFTASNPPVDYPAMTVLLVSHLLNTGNPYWLEKRGGIIFEKAHILNRSTPQMSIGRAVAEAFARANKLLPESSEAKEKE